MNRDMNRDTATPERLAGTDDRFAELIRRATKCAMNQRIDATTLPVFRAAWLAGYVAGEEDEAFVWRDRTWQRVKAARRRMFQWHILGIVVGVFGGAPVVYALLRALSLCR